VRAKWSRDSGVLMDNGRREFLSTVALGSLGVTAAGMVDWRNLPAQQAASHWDLGWVKKLRGKYRAVFDVPEIEDGFGVWRAVIWRRQYSQIFGIPESSLDTVIVLRSDAVALALNQDFWLHYDLGKRWNVHDPSTGQSTARNPLIDRTGPNALPAQFSGFTLEALMAGGATVLVCTLALHDCAVLVAEKEHVPMEEADRQVRRLMIPGIVLQPSGVFAAVLAQDNGCRYVRAS
jgi:hypothetical protein